MLHLAEGELDKPHPKPTRESEADPDLDSGPEIPMAEVQETAVTEEQT